MSSMSSPRSSDNASTISLAGSACASCQQCESVLKNAQEREHQLENELEAARNLAHKYELELADARLELSKLTMVASTDKEPITTEHHTTILEEKRKLLQHQLSAADGHPRPPEANIYRRRCSEGYATIPTPIAIHPDAPPSFEEKKWWKCENLSPRCPRGCKQVEETRREHYKMWHYNVYYAFVNHEDGYSERQRWMCTLFGDQAGGLRVCLHCERLPNRYYLHGGQLDLAHHIKDEHPDVFASLALQHSRHCSNIAAIYKIPYLPGQIDLLLEKTLNEQENQPIHAH